MSLLDRLKKALSAPGGGNRNYWVHVRCKRCGEVITARVDMMNDLSRDFDMGRFTVRKVLVGDGAHRCFQRIDVTLHFDKNKRLIDRSITGGDFLQPEEVDAAKAAYEQKIAEMKARAEAERRAREERLSQSDSQSQS